MLLTRVKDVCGYNYNVDMNENRIWFMLMGMKSVFANMLTGMKNIFGYILMRVKNGGMLFGKYKTFLCYLHKPATLKVYI